ncbi:anaerobic dimethyl sulfoxide reductase chain B [Vibrio astriarenae]|nr:anaerobic dimethyl sulfoxide reductase chain B [Vibrio sp. C7]
MTKCDGCFERVAEGFELSVSVLVLFVHLNLAQSTSYVRSMAPMQMLLLYRLRL